MTLNVVSVAYSVRKLKKILNGFANNFMPSIWMATYLLWTVAELTSK